MEKKLERLEQKLDSVIVARDISTLGGGVEQAARAFQVLRIKGLIGDAQLVLFALRMGSSYEEPEIRSSIGRWANKDSFSSTLAIAYGGITTIVNDRIGRGNASEIYQNQLIEGMLEYWSFVDRIRLVGTNYSALEDDNLFQVVLKFELGASRWNSVGTSCSPDEAMRVAMNDGYKLPVVLAQIT